MVNLQKVGKSPFGEIDENAMRMQLCWVLQGDDHLVKRLSGMLFLGPDELLRTTQVSAELSMLEMGRRNDDKGLGPGLTRAFQKRGQDSWGLITGKYAVCLGFLGLLWTWLDDPHCCWGGKIPSLPGLSSPEGEECSLDLPMQCIKQGILPEKYSPTVAAFCLSVCQNIYENAKRCVLGIVSFIGRGFTPQFLVFSCHSLNASSLPSQPQIFHF